ncbi:HAD family acid phosphatase [Streptomyces sp. P1-3]|uniref:HAD family acid phosphatase n=1 Tax=Streptomyces sp. P1-3 TaxID=3421658 RepID=UPI003D35AF03
MTGRGVRHRIGAVSVVLALGLGGTATASAAAAPASAPALSTTAARATADVDYATWQRDVQAVIDEAIPYIEERTANAHGQKLALVFDVDNTTLETDFHPWYQLPTPALKPSLELARYAKSRGVDIIFVTARPGIIHSLTKWNLESEGYPVSAVHVRDLPDLFEEVSAYKTGKRAEIEEQGYTIIGNVGNRETDLVGGHAERTFKLPDYNGQLS